MNARALHSSALLFVVMLGGGALSCDKRRDLAPPTSPPDEGVKVSAAFEPMPPRAPRAKFGEVATLKDPSRSPVGRFVRHPDTPGEQSVPVWLAHHERCRAGELLQIVSDHPDASKRARTPHLSQSFLIAARPPFAPGAYTEHLLISPRTVTLSEAKGEEGVRVFSVDDPPVRIVLDEPLDALPWGATQTEDTIKAGCLHSGQFAVSHDGRELLRAESAYGYYTPSREVYTFELELTREVSLMLLLFLPQRRGGVGALAHEEDLREAFKAPMKSDVRVFVETRDERFKESITPITDGSIRYERADPSSPFSVHLTIEALPEALEALFPGADSLAIRAEVKALIE